MSKNWIYLLVISLFSILGMKALIHPGLFTAHDIYHQVVRLYYYSQAINDGQILPHWVSQLANRFGYPLFFFSYQLPWIIGVLLLKIGLGIPTAIKALFFLSYMTSGLSMFLFVNSLLKNKLSALASSILYLWLPYHFLIIFVGASMGIAFVFTFLPLLLLGIHLTFKKNGFGPIITALGFSGITLSHIMHIIFLSPLITIFIIWEIILNKKRSFKGIVLGFFLGFLLSSFYLIPAAFYNRYTRVHQETGFSEVYKRNFLNLNQIIYSKWGYGPIINNAKEGEISFQLGIVQWIAVFILILLVTFKKITNKYRSLAISMLLGFAITIFLMLDFSKPIWAFLTKIITADFPYRLLLPASFIASICAGIILVSINKKFQILIFVLFILIALYTNRNHINVNQYTNIPIASYLETPTEITTNTYHEYLPVNANGKLFDKPWKEAFADNIYASNVKQNTKLLSFDLMATKESKVIIGQFYFPGQTLYLDSKPTNYDINQDGLISFTSPQGSHKITVVYEETIPIKLSKALTIFGILFLFFLTRKALKS